MEIAGAADDSNTLITLGRRYIYDGWSVVEERTFDSSATLGNSPNTLERVYVNGRSIDEPLLVAIDGDGDGFLNSSKNTTNGVNLVDAEYYYLSNRLGSISAILDADNSDRILEYYRYEIFGSATVLPIVDNNTDGIEDTPLDLNDNNALGATLVSSFGNTYLYTARRFDDVTGLYYYRNRYYDPRSGRFITRDPAKYVDGYNLYSYVTNAIGSAKDPLGLWTEVARKELDTVKVGSQESEHFSIYKTIIEGPKYIWFCQARGCPQVCFEQGEELYECELWRVTGMIEYTAKVSVTFYLRFDLVTYVDPWSLSWMLALETIAKFRSAIKLYVNAGVEVKRLEVRHICMVPPGNKEIDGIPVRYALFTADNYLEEYIEENFQKTALALEGINFLEHLQEAKEKFKNAKEALEDPFKAFGDEAEDELKERAGEVIKDFLNRFKRK